MGTEPDTSGRTTVTAEVPATEITRYAIDLRSVSHGAGDGTGNPYLTLIGLLAAGLDGIEQSLPLGEPTTDDIGHLSEADASARGLALLPRSAPEALDALEADAVLMDALGPVIGPGFLRIRRSEAAAYALEVGDWERATYLEWS